MFSSEGVAGNYRLHLEPHLFGPWAARFVEWAGVRAGDTVLDVAAGTGAVASAAAAVGAAVTATDPSDRMLAGVPRPIRTLLAEADALPLPDSSVDLALCQQGLQFVPDRAAALREMLRVVHPGGTIAVAVWASGHRLDPLDAYADALGRSNGSVTMEPAEVAALLRAAGAIDVVCTVEALEVRWPSLDSEVQGLLGTPFGPFVEGLDAARRSAVLESVRAALDDGAGGTRPHVTTAVLARGRRP